jgi:sugar phosphate isomerase/epimerase
VFDKQAEPPVKLVLFSKHWPGVSIAGMIEKTQYAGADGLDLAVRPGFAVHPGNVASALPAAVEDVRSAGLDIPMVTCDASFIDPEAPEAETMAAAVAEAGVPVAKLGYWRWKGTETPYWQEVDRIRRALEGFEVLAQKFGIKFCYHTHSDYFGLNACSMMDLLRERDPEYIGAYLDTGHLAYCGEPFKMAIDVVGEYLGLVSFKDTFFKRTAPADEELPAWKRAIVPAGHGVVKWPEVMAGLQQAGYDGTISAHCEFQAESPEAFTELQKREIAFLRAEWAKAQETA